MLTCKYCNNELLEIGDDKFVCNVCKKEYTIKIENSFLQKSSEYQIYINYNISEATSKLGEELYKGLSKLYKVFYAPSMNKSLGQSGNVENTIQLALTQAKIMIVFCDNVVNVESKTLKDEVSTFMCYKDKVVIPIMMNNFDFNDLPNYLRSQTFYHNDSLLPTLEKYIYSLLSKQRIISENAIKEEKEEIKTDNFTEGMNCFLKYDIHSAKEFFHMQDTAKSQYMFAFLEKEESLIDYYIKKIKNSNDKDKNVMLFSYFVYKSNYENAKKMLDRLSLDDVFVLYLNTELLLKQNKFREVLPHLTNLLNKNEILGKIQFSKYYLNRRNPLTNKITGVENLISAIELGAEDADIFFDIAYYYSTGYCVEKDNNKAFEYYSKSLELGNLEAGLKLVNMYIEGIGVHKNNDIAREIVDDLIENEYFKTYAFYGELLVNKFLYKTGFEFIKNGVKIDDLDSIYALGKFISLGVGVQKDLQQGMGLIYKAAKNGCVKAQYHLGKYYFEIRKYENSEKWLKMAANRNNVDAIKILFEGIDKGLFNIKANLAIKMLEKIYLNTKEDVIDLIITSSYKYGLYDVAIKYAEIEKQYKNTLAIYTLGKCLFEGNGTTKSIYDAYEMFLEGAKLGNPECQFYTYLALSKLHINDESLVEAVQWLRKASENGLADAQVEFAKLYQTGEKGLTQSNFEFCRWLKKSAELNQPEAQYLLGLCYLSGVEGGVMKSHKEGMKWLTKSAEQGYSDAMFELGYCWFYADGIIQRQDKREAVKWFKLASQNNVTKAMIELSNCYFTQSGTSYNPDKAIEYLEKASALDDPEAHYILALCYFDGKGVERDNVKAINYLLKADKKNYAIAIYQLANCYQTGYGITKNSNEAIRLYEKAIRLGNLESMYALGVMYYSGDGVIKNTVKAKELLEEAADQGYQLAIDFLAKKF